MKGPRSSRGVGRTGQGEEWPWKKGCWEQNWGGEAGQEAWNLSSKDQLLLFNKKLDSEPVSTINLQGEVPRMGQPTSAEMGLLALPLQPRPTLATVL